MPRRTIALFLAVLSVAALPVWGSSLDLLCNARAIADFMVDGEFQKALGISVGCEDRILKNMHEDLAEPLLRSSYLVSAQILAAQGKLAAARDRLDKAKKIPDNFLIDTESLVDTTEGYLLERAGQTGEAERYYLQIPRPDAHVRLAVLYLANGRSNEAFKVITEVLQTTPLHPAAHAVLGDLLRQSDKTAALREYELALSLAGRGNPSVVPLTYLEVGRAKRGIAQLH